MVVGRSLSSAVYRRRRSPLSCSSSTFVFGRTGRYIVVVVVSNRLLNNMLRVHSHHTGSEQPFSLSLSRCCRLQCLSRYINATLWLTHWIHDFEFYCTWCEYNFHSFSHTSNSYAAQLYSHTHPITLYDTQQSTTHNTQHNVRMDVSVCVWVRPYFHRLRSSLFIDTRPEEKFSFTTQSDQYSFLSSIFHTYNALAFILRPFPSLPLPHPHTDTFSIVPRLCQASVCLSVVSQVCARECVCVCVHNGIGFDSHSSLTLLLLLLLFTLDTNCEPLELRCGCDWASLCSFPFARVSFLLFFSLNFNQNYLFYWKFFVCVYAMVVCVTVIRYTNIEWISGRR